METALREVWSAIKASNTVESDTFPDLHYGILDGFKETTFIANWKTLSRGYTPSTDQPLVIFVGKIPRTSLALPKLEPGKNCLRIGNVYLIMSEKRALMFCEAFTSLAKINQLNFSPEFSSQITDIRAQYEPELLTEVAEQLPTYFGSPYILNRYINSEHDIVYRTSSLDINLNDTSVEYTKSIINQEVGANFSTWVKLPSNDKFGNDLEFFHNDNVLIASVKENLYNHLAGIKIAQLCNMRMVQNCSIDPVNRIIYYGEKVTPLSMKSQDFLRVNEEKIIQQISEEVRILHDEYGVAHGQICLNRIVELPNGNFALLPSACMNSPDTYMHQYFPYDDMEYDGEINTVYQYDKFCLGALRFELHFGFTIIDERLLPANFPIIEEGKVPETFEEGISYILFRSTHPHRKMAIYANLIKVNAEIIRSLLSYDLEDHTVNDPVNKHVDNEYVRFIVNIDPNRYMRFEIDSDEYPEFEIKVGRRNFWYRNHLSTFAPIETRRILKDAFHSWIGTSSFFGLVSNFGEQFNARTYRYLATLVEILWGMYFPTKYFDTVKQLPNGVYDYEADALRAYPDQVKDVEVIPESQLDRFLFGVFTDRVLSSGGIYYTRELNV